MAFFMVGSQSRAGQVVVRVQQRARATEASPATDTTKADFTSF